jgi:integrase
MFKRTRFQEGCLTREKRKTGPKVWIYRWREYGPDGRRINRKVVVGTTKEYRTESDAKKAIEGLRLDVNKESTRTSCTGITVEQLVAHYIDKELSDGSSKKAHSTVAIYKTNIKTWILPRWGSYQLRDVKSVAVEAWLGSLVLADGTKAKIRNIMSAIFNHAMRYEWVEKNPITLVRQSAKRKSTPDVLEVDELKSLLSELEGMDYLIALLDACTGLRIGELLALQWRDIDFEAMEIRPSRAIFHQVVGNLKTEASKRARPLDSYLAELLTNWKTISPYNKAEDWVFASAAMAGRQPYWPDSFLRKRIRPAGERAGIKKRIGWHTFRRTYATLLKANGEDVKVVQELLAHANSQITLNIYAQAVSSDKRKAQSKVVEMIRPERAVVPFCSHGEIDTEGVSA